jgi:CATRA-Associated Small Protein
MDVDATSIRGLLGSVLEWELTNDGWHRVEEALDMLTAAIGREDPVAARRAATALMLNGPRRAGTSLSDALKEPPQRPVPLRTRDVINRLLHQIGFPPEPERGTLRGAKEPGDLAEPPDERAPNAGRDESA